MLAVVETELLSKVEDAALMETVDDGVTNDDVSVVKVV